MIASSAEPIRVECNNCLQTIDIYKDTDRLAICPNCGRITKV